MRTLTRVVVRVQRYNLFNRRRKNLYLFDKHNCEEGTFDIRCNYYERNRYTDGFLCNSIYINAFQ